MPSRKLRDLTPEELAELQEEGLGPRARVPKLPGAQASSERPWRARMPTASDVRFLDAPTSGIRDDLLSIELGDEEDDPGANAWLDQLIGNPPQTPRQPQVSAAGPGGTYSGGDTPEARELIKSRGMQVTSPPSDDELLEALTAERPATMPELDDGATLDDLIRSEGKTMDREQAEAARPPAPPRQSREDALRGTLQAPTRAQGWLSVLADTLYGGNAVDNVNARAQQYQGAMAQARLQDVAAGERSDERAADREMTDARMALTQRGQDMADARAGESRELRWLLEQERDKRVREEGAKGRDAAMERTQVNAASRAAGEAPPVSAEEAQAGTAAFLAAQANVPKAKARAFIAGQTDDLTPEEIERLEVNHDQWKIMSPKKRQDVLAGGMRREGATPDALDAAAQRKQQDPEKRLAARNELLGQHASIKEASEAWRAMSPTAKQVMARVGGGDSTFASATRSAMLSPEDQARAAKIQGLANALIKAQSGASVTANEWRRVAKELGLPEDAFSVFNSPASIDAWLKKSRDGFRMVRDSTLQTYQGLFDEGAP
jgi:hypothetical protein